MGQRTLRVITYHRIGYPDRDSELNPRMISATPEVFERQAAYLARKFSVLSAADLLDVIVGKRALPRRAAVVTFDDGYRDVGEIAWPILKRFNLPAILFIPTDFPDRPENQFWWDRLYRAIVHTGEASYSLEGLGEIQLEDRRTRLSELKRMQNYLKGLPPARLLEAIDQIAEDLGVEEVSENGVMSWSELRALHREGLTLAAHTKSHCILPLLSPDEVRAEVSGSQQKLEEEIGTTLPVFSYPNGSHDDTVVEIVRDCGFILAFSTRDGVNDLSQDNLLRLRRTNITPRTTPLLFRFRLSNQGARFDQWRRG